MSYVENKKRRAPAENGYVGVDLGVTTSEYAYDFQKTTGVKFKKVGEVDNQEEINSHLQECDVFTLRQLISAADIDPNFTLLSDFIDDMSQIPDNIFELQQLTAYAKQQFEQLPLEIRKKYGNSFESLADAVRSGSIDSIDLQTPQGHDADIDADNIQVSDAEVIGRLVAEYRANHRDSKAGGDSGYSGNPATGSSQGENE